MSRKPPKKKVTEYNEELYGTYGEIGTGNTKIRFIQTAFPIDQISQLTLVADLAGSEKWPVRQLFQRDIDINRVTDDIIPYFEQLDRIKFYNPLTIAALPITNSSFVADNVKEAILKKGDGEDEDSWGAVEAKGYYKLSHEEDSHGWAKLCWNTRQLKLVAIDGQHRLSALKRLSDEYHRNPSDEKFRDIGFEKWSVPIILFIAPPEVKNSSRLTLLDKTRDIFVTINKQAKPPTRCRTILLNDYKISSTCCQELLDHCHEDELNEVPLMFFDWRANSDGEYPETPAALLRVEELEDFHSHYIMLPVEDDEEWSSGISESERKSLFLDDMDPQIDLKDKIKMRIDIRLRYKETVMPGILNIIKMFNPIKTYVKFLQGVLNKPKTDIEKHALSMLTYGKHHGASSLSQDIEKEYGKMREECEKEKSKIEPIFQKLIGLRGIYCGFALTADAYWSYKRTASWDDISKEYANSMNMALASGMFKWNKSGHLRHIAVDHNGNAINYKLPHSWDGFGAYCALIACAYDDKLSSEKDVIDGFVSRLSRVLVRGYKKELRPILEESSPTLSKQKLNELITAKADAKCKVHINKLKRELKV